MRHIHLSLLLLLLVAQPFVSVQAQITHASQGRLDENATAALNKAAKKMDANVRFTVQVKMLDAQHKTTLDQTVQVRYNKGKYHIQHPDFDLICDGTILWNYNKGASEVTVADAVTDNEGINLLNPASLLSDYGKHFKAKYIRTDDDGSAVIDLTPRSAQYYHKIRLYINEESGLLHRVEVHKYDSGREFYIVTDFRRATSTPSQFTFDPTKHPGVEVIDMR